MKIEFIIKDRNGVELFEGDRVNWHVEEELIPNTCFGIKGEILSGILVFYRTKEQVKEVYQKTPSYKYDLEHNITTYCPSQSATFTLMFIADHATWVINCPFEAEDYRHPKLEKVEL